MIIVPLIADSKTSFNFPSNPEVMQASKGPLSKTDIELSFTFLILILKLVYTLL
jgi:hypothetical protein